jgi:RND family efflux transporter MFP subunit
VRRALQILLPLVTVAGGIYGAAWLIQNPRVTEPKKVEAYQPRVELVTVVMGNYRPVILAQGTVNTRMSTSLSPQVSGRIVAISPKLAAGGLFAEGDELLRVDASDYELSLRQARARIDTARAGITNALAQMSSARAQMAQAEARIVREEAEAAAALSEWRLLGRSGILPALLAREPQLKEARAGLASAVALAAAAAAKRKSDEAALVVAHAAGEQAATNVVRCVVRAPFNGRVSSRVVGLGQVVAPGSVLARLQSVDVAEVRLALPLDEFTFLDLPDAFRGGANSANGPVARLRASHGNDLMWAGRIVRSVGEVDQGTRMMTVIAEVTDPYRVAPGSTGAALSFGMFVRAEIYGRELTDVAVLPRIVLRGGDRVYVLRDGALYTRRVQVAWSTREVVVVSGGLRDGDQVCLTAVDAFVEGMPVVVMEGFGDE